MKNAANNPWFAWLAQVWLVQQVTHIAARSIDPRLVQDPLTLSGRTGEVLDPLEFHGKRRSSPAPAASASEWAKRGGPAHQRQRLA